jgi:hypothetical protein
MTLVGDNNNKVTAPNLFMYRRLLLKTPTRAVVVLIVLLFDARLVGDNNNKATAPNLIIYRRMLLKTPTRAVHTPLIFLLRIVTRPCLFAISLLFKARTLRAPRVRVITNHQTFLKYCN